MAKIIDKVTAAKGALDMRQLVEHNLKGTNPDRVLSTVYRDGTEYIVPASLDIVIRFRVVTCPSFKKLLGSEILQKQST